MEKKMVKTWLTPEEKETLANKAKFYGLSEAEYLRRLIASDLCVPAYADNTVDDDEEEKTLYRVCISQRAYDILMDNVSQTKMDKDAYINQLILDGRVTVIPYDYINDNIFALCDALDRADRRVESAIIVARRENKDMSDMMDTIVSELDELNKNVRKVVRDNKTGLQKIRRTLQKEVDQ